MQELSNRGWAVTVAGCRGYLGQFCNAMAASGLNPQSDAASKELICTSCRQNAGRIYSNPESMEHLWLEEWLNPDDYQLVDEFLAGVSESNWPDAQFQSLAIGRLAAFEFLITYKIHSFAIPAGLWNSYLIFLRNVALTCLGAFRILESQRPDRVIVYNSLYGVNRVWQEIAERRGIPAFSIHAGSASAALDSLQLYRNDDAQKTLFQSDAPSSALLQPLHAAQVKEVSLGLINQLFASNVFVYSSAHAGLSPSAIRKQLG